jgi:hypothetical protein
MRLDKMVGKASMMLKVKVYDWDSNELLFLLINGAEFDDVKEDMKKYKVRFYNVEKDSLVIFVKERR